MNKKEGQKGWIAMETPIQEADDDIINSAVGAVMLTNEVEITPPSSVDLVRGSMSRPQTFESDDSDLRMRLNIEEEMMNHQNIEHKTNSPLLRDQELNE